MDTRDFDLAVGAKNEETKQTMESCSRTGRGNDYESSFCYKKPKKTHSFLTVIFPPQLFEWPVENVYGRQQQHFITYERNKQSNLVAFNA